MKNIFKVLICFALITSLLALGACGKDDKKNESADSKDISTESAESTESSEASAESSETSSEHSEFISMGSTLEADETIIGTWYAVGYSLMLKEEGKGVYCVDGELIPLTWETSEGKLTVTVEDVDASLPEDEEYSISEDGTTLTVGNKVYKNAPIEVSDDVDTSLVGTWYSYDSTGEEITVFNADGTGYMTSLGTNIDMTWSIKNGVLVMSMDMDSMVIDMQADSYRLEGDTLYITIMGEEGVFTKTRKPLGGNEELVGTWIEPNAPIVDDYPDYKYSITFVSDGTGDYTEYGDEESPAYSFIWSEKDGKISFTVYSTDWDTFEEEEVASVTASYTISENSTILTLTDGSKTTTFEFYEEEYVYVPEIDVDTDHPLGGDNAIVGDWELDVDGEHVAFSIKADGTFILESDIMETECVWYTDDGYIMVYMNGFDAPLAMMHGEYRVDGDLLIINDDGDYTACARKGSGAAGFAISVYETDEEWIDIESSVIYKENGNDTILEFSVSTNITDLKFVSFTNTGGNHTQATTLYEVPALGTDEFFVAFTTVNTGDTIKGISFTAPNGKTISLLITYNEETEYYCFADITDGAVQ